MRIVIPRYLIVGIAALFSAFHVVVGVYALLASAAWSPDKTGPVIVSLALYFAVSAIVLVPIGPSRMPIWMAAFSVSAVVVMSLLVSTDLDPAVALTSPYATAWYIGAVGTLLTIVAARGRTGFAWAGTAFLVAQTIAWAGPPAVLTLGVVGSVTWVAAAHVISSGMARATRDASRFTLAEREATDWQALQEAHLHERQFRLGQTSSMALAMLRTIQDSGGELTEAQRQECLYLEGAIRDEIRGRRLLNDEVRTQVMLARRRGTTVTLLDEGGIDELEDAALDNVLNQLAEAIRLTHADKVIARTVQDSDVAITVVGLHSTDDENASALGEDASEDDEVDLWLEIPRS